MKIIAINGVGGSGKDTFVRACNEVIPCGLTSTIDPIKLMLHSQGIYRGIFTHRGWVGEVKGPKERKLLSTIKNSLTEYNDYPMLKLNGIIRNFGKLGINIVFVMVREFSEMMKIVDLYGAKTMLIQSDWAPICETEQSFLDQIPDNYVWDYKFNNNSDKASFEGKAEYWVTNINEV